MKNISRKTGGTIQMSPYENYDHGASELRTHYAYLFDVVVRIYKLYHQNEKVATRYETVVELTLKLYDEEIFDDYIFESLKAVYKLYPTLLPGVVQKGYEENREKEIKHLNKLYELLLITQRDLSEVLYDILKEDQERFKKEWSKRYN